MLHLMTIMLKPVRFIIGQILSLTSDTLNHINWIRIFRRNNWDIGKTGAVNRIDGVFIKEKIFLSNLFKTSITIPIIINIWKSIFSQSITILSQTASQLLFRWKCLDAIFPTGQFPSSNLLNPSLCLQCLFESENTVQIIFI